MPGKQWSTNRKNVNQGGAGGPVTSQQSMAQQYQSYQGYTERDSKIYPVEPRMLMPVGPTRRLIYRYLIVLLIGIFIGLTIAYYMIR